MNGFSNEKKLVLDYFDALENSDYNNVEDSIKEFISDDYTWRSVYPYRQQDSLKSACTVFYNPIKKAIKQLQRRQDIFIAGNNEVEEGVWVMSMGHFMGLFDEEFLGLRPTHKMINIRYAEFNHVKDNKIVQTGLFMDLIGFMQQAGVNPLPLATGNYFIYPGPRDHNGLLFEDADPNESIKTQALVNKMVDDLSALNDSGAMGCPPEVLEKSWSKNMIWYGPAGIGASYTIPRYQIQHQLPFRNNLKDKKFNGHVCRFSEGNFSCFFGWPNLSNTPIGGFLGLPGGEIRADMQVVDVYYRKEDKLVENWVLIDIPYWLKQQGLDLFERSSAITNMKL